MFDYLKVALSLLQWSSLTDPQRRLLPWICQKSRRGDKLALVPLIIRKGEARSLFSPGSYLSNMSGSPRGTQDFYDQITAYASQNEIYKAEPRQRKLEHFFTNLQKVCFNRRDQPRGSRGGSWLLLSGCALLMQTSHSNGFSQTPQQTYSLTIKEEVMKPWLRTQLTQVREKPPSQQLQCTRQSPHLVPWTAHNSDTIYWHWQEADFFFKSQFYKDIWDRECEILLIICVCG